MDFKYFKGRKGIASVLKSNRKYFATFMPLSKVFPGSVQF